MVLGESSPLVRELGKQIGGVLAAVATLLCLAGCDALAGATREDTFQVGPSPILIVENSNGEVRVKGTDRQTIDVVTAMRNADNVDYSATQTGNTVTVRAKTRNSLLNSPRIDIAISAPVGTTATVSTGNGLVSLEGLRGTGSATTGNGPVGLADVQGVFQATTGNGRVSTSAASGAFVLSSGNGDVVFRGQLEAGSESRFDTGNGSVTVEFTGRPNVAFDASTGSGRVRSQLALSATTRDERKHLAGTIGEGEADLHARTGHGDVTIR